MPQNFRMFFNQTNQHNGLIVGLVLALFPPLQRAWIDAQHVREYGLGDAEVFTHVTDLAFAEPGGWRCRRNDEQWTQTLFSDFLEPR